MIHLINSLLVVRHPDHRSIDNNVLFWSHHEVYISKKNEKKKLVIDAFAYSM